MPKDQHNTAADHHEKAAKSHRAAAEHHGKGDHEAGHRHSGEAQEAFKERAPAFPGRTHQIHRSCQEVAEFPL